MKIQNTAINSLLYLLYMFGGCVAVMAVEALLVYIVSRIVIIPYPALTILRLVIYTLGVPAIMSGIGYVEGYREGVPAIKETVVGGVLAMILHVLFAILFGFHAFVSGGVRFAAGLIRHGMDITDELLNTETPTGLFLLMFALYGAIYVAALCISRYLGAQNRIISRAELRRGETPENE